ncbi:MAG: hypothetical protein SVY41_01745 [Candidatus Nanohaloarchaea archaeon]|nr:hypothetical protein [Candidatus Nanohaloarchaea archaeon]
MRDNSYHDGQPPADPTLERIPERDRAETASHTPSDPGTDPAYPFTDDRTVEEDGGGEYVEAFLRNDVEGGEATLADVFPEAIHAGAVLDRELEEEY